MTVVAEPRPGLRVYATAQAGGANVSLVSIRIERMDGKPGVYLTDIWLSDAASGQGLTATTASGAIVAGATGTILGTDSVAKKAFRIMTNAAGSFTLSITDTAKTLFYIVVAIEGRGEVLMRLTTANYG